MEGVTMAETVIVRHPIRGLLWGLLLGIGLAFVLVFSTLMEFAVLPITVTIVIGLVFGVLWGLLGPARSPKSPPPEPVPVAAGTPAPSRFDDSTESSAPHAEQAADPGEAKPPEPADCPASLLHRRPSHHHSSTMSAVTMPNIPSSPSAWVRMWQCHAHTPGSVSL